MKDLLEALQALQDTPVPGLLVTGGIVLIFCAVVRALGGTIIFKLDPKQQKLAAIIGTSFLILGIGLFLVPKPDGPTRTPVKSTNTPTSILDTPTPTPSSTRTPSTTPMVTSTTPVVTLTPTLTATPTLTPTDTHVPTPTVFLTPPSECTPIGGAVEPSVCVAGVSVQINGGTPRPVAYEERLTLKAGDTLRLLGLRYCTSREALADSVAGEVYLFTNRVESYDNGLFTRGGPRIRAGCGDVGDFMGNWVVGSGQHRVVITLVHYFGNNYEVDDRFFFNLIVEP